MTSEWRDLWHATERGLFAADATPPQDWLERAAAAAAGVEVPRRERWFPNRLAYWLPSLATIMFAVCIVPGSTKAESGEPVSNAADVIQAQQAAQKALGANWNDWAAHHNVAAARIQEGDWNTAIAHATASFLQHPSATTTRETLRVALEQTQTADPHLHRMLSGAWYERIPALMSAAGWQRLAFAAGFIIASALTALVLALYVPNGVTTRRYLLWAGRGGLAVGILLFANSIAGWNGYGAMNQPTAAILLQNANLSPVPTDLVPVEETSPLAAGTVVLTQRSFLGWQQISVGENSSGWVRRNSVMPFYAKRS